MKPNRGDPRYGRPPRPPRRPPPVVYDSGGGDPAGVVGDYIVLPPQPPTNSASRRLLRRLVSAVVYVLLPLSLFCGAVFLLWPSDPLLTVVRLRLDHIGVSSVAPVSIDISMDLTLRVRNPDFFSVYYESIEVSIRYRGKQLGFVTSDSGFIRARGTSYVNATLRLDGIEVLHDVLYLLEDLARGSIPFDTVTDFRGQLRLFLLDIPLQARVSCEVLVNTKNQSVIRQDCYPEGMR